MALIEADCIVACDCDDIDDAGAADDVPEVNVVNEVVVNGVDEPDIANQVAAPDQPTEIAPADDVFPEAVSVHYYPAMARIVVFLASGSDVSFAPSDVLGLENANHDELSHAQISPSGLGVCFPELHVDLYIPGLVEGVVGSESWLAPQMRCSRHQA